jgi:hypothetical protein
MSRFPGIKKAISGTPKLFISTTYKGWNSAVYLVNNTPYPLISASVSVGGFCSADDDVLTVSGQTRTYKEVKPKEAVLLDEYHLMYDSDYVLQVDIEVEFKGNNIEHFRIVRKGGFEEIALLNEDDSSKYFINQKTMS